MRNPRLSVIVVIVMVGLPGLGWATAARRSIRQLRKSITTWGGKAQTQWMIGGEKRGLSPFLCAPHGCSQQLHPNKILK